MDTVDTQVIAAPIVRDDEECAQFIRDYGQAERELAVLKAAMKQELADICARYEAAMTRIEQGKTVTFQAVQRYCERQRIRLVASTRKKSYAFGTAGEVTWRLSKPSVRVADDAVERVIVRLQNLNLDHLLNYPVTLDKNAILKSPQSVKDIEEISVDSDEYFEIKAYPNQD